MGVVGDMIIVSQLSTYYRSYERGSMMDTEGITIERGNPRSVIHSNRIAYSPLCRPSVVLAVVLGHWAWSLEIHFGYDTWRLLN